MCACIDVRKKCGVRKKNIVLVFKLILRKYVRVLLCVYTVYVHEHMYVGISQRGKLLRIE